MYALSAMLAQHYLGHKDPGPYEPIIIIMCRLAVDRCCIQHSRAKDVAAKVDKTKHKTDTMLLMRR